MENPWKMEENHLFAPLFGRREAPGGGGEPAHGPGARRGSPRGE